MYPSYPRTLTRAKRLLEAVQTRFGRAGLEGVMDDLMTSETADYKRRIGAPRPLRSRLAALAAIRTEDGYMAEWSQDDSGASVLIQNHCPLMATAGCCAEICQCELEMFTNVLGSDVHVVRTEYIPDGDRRCVYCITAVDGGGQHRVRSGPTGQGD